MSHLIGRGRNARETYPDRSGNSSSIAQQNRNIAAETVLPGFTPATNPNFSPIAALLYTPKVSGVVSVSVIAVLSAAADNYAIAVAILTGTGLSVTGGSATSDGWVMGTATPPVIGGVVATNTLLGEFVSSIPSVPDQGSLMVSGLSQQIAPGGPLPVGEPVVIEVLLSELTGGNAITSLALTQLSVMEVG